MTRYRAGKAGVGIILALLSLPSLAYAKNPVPPAGAQETFAGCTWREIKGASLSIWSFACGKTQDGAHLIADNKLPGFRLASTEPDTRIAIEAFAKPADAPIAAILPAIRAASPGVNTATCTLVPYDDAETKTFSHGAKQFMFEPTGAAKTAWDKAEKEGGPADPPCGALGIYFDRSPLFWVLPGDKTTVVAVDMGSEIQIFDPSTLKRISPR
jgi:hypothetical protein